MAIPKEPRQLMINLMYLVLTAMLALNVSAEIFNAFKLVDKGLVKSNGVLDNANDRIPAEVARLAKKEPKRLGKYTERTEPTRELAKIFCDSIDAVVTRLKDFNGDGIYNDEDDVIKLDENGVEYNRYIRNKKNKDITTRYLVGPVPADNAGKGAQIEEMVKEYRQKFLELIDEEDREAFGSKIALNVDEDYKHSKDKLNWSHYNFFQMPVAAVLPIFSKLKNDAKSTESAVLNYFLEKCGGESIVFDKFRVVSSPKKSYIIKGEKYESDIFLSASSQNIKGMSVTVGGSSLPVKEGVAKYTATAGSTGVKKYTATISITNPVTGEKTTERGEFEYEVGERSCNVAAEKMNVFYIGVDNPVSVTAAGISSNALKVNGSGVTLRPGSSRGKYVATASRPGDATITVSGGGLKATNFKFRVKRIPDPIPVLGAGPNKTGGAMGNGEFKAQQGLASILENFDFDAKCKIMGYSLTRVAKRQDPVENSNAGARYDSKSKRLVDAAKPGDVYYFDNVKTKCPGDSAGRKLPSVVFKIK